MANDLAAMIARIASEMARPDFAVGGSREQRTREAIATAISEYQYQRFRFSDIDPANPTTFNTVPGQYVYTNPLIATIHKIDYLNIAIGNTLQQLGQVTPEEQHLNIQLFNQSGFPSSFAYEGNSFILYPVPDQIWTLYLGAHLDVSAPAADDTANNVWMTVAELLIRCRAKYELYKHVLRNTAMADQMSPDIDGYNGKPGETYKAWRTLKGDAAKITGRGKVKAMRF